MLMAGTYGKWNLLLDTMYKIEVSLFYDVLKKLTINITVLLYCVILTLATLTTG